MFTSQAVRVMNRVLTFGAAIYLLAGCSVDAQIFGDSFSSSSLTYYRGVSIMDLGMSGGVIPGVYNTNYTKTPLAKLAFLKGQGADVVRVPFLWERVQPTLGGSLNATYLEYILETLRNANAVGLKVILDMHNYAGYNISGTIHSFGEDLGPTAVQYADVWKKLAVAIKADPLAYGAVYAYDIMNEPIGIPDTRNTVPIATAHTAFTFDASNENWAARSTETVAQDSSRAPGALKITYPAGSSGTVIAGAAVLASQRPLYLSDGPTLRIRGFLPSSTNFTAPRIRIGMYNGSYQYFVSAPSGTMITAGKAFDLHFTPADFSRSGSPSTIAGAAIWTGYHNLMIELIVDSNNGSAVELYIDDIYQGTPIVGQSSEKTWEEYSQAAVDAIRTADTAALLMIEGYSYSSASNWATHHPTKWITDPNDNIMYHAHTYFDSNSSGAYALSFADEELAAQAGGYASVAERAVARVKVFTDWTQAQGVRGFVGEYGWPNSVVSTDWEEWNGVGEAFLNHLDSVKMGATMWGTGSWLDADDNDLNMFDLKTLTPLSQTDILKRHPGR